MLRPLFFAFAISAIAGCSQFANLQDAQQAEELWARQQLILGEYNNWDIHARAAIRLEGEFYNIGIRWQRDDRRFKMLLEAPFGQGVFRIESSEGDIYRLRLPDGQVFENHTAEALLEEVIGWSLPISGLEYWIRGLPRPGSTYSYRSGAGGRTRSINQDQWAIDYLDYFVQQEDPQLPRRIKLVSDKVTLKLIVERWQQAKLNDSPSELFPDFN